jgi:hypothetical protein
MKVRITFWQVPMNEAMDLVTRLKDFPWKVQGWGLESEKLSEDMFDDKIGESKANKQEVVPIATEEMKKTAKETIEKITKEIDNKNKHNFKK